MQKSINTKLEQSKELCDEEKFNFNVYMVIFPILQFVICLIGVAYISYSESGILQRIAGYANLTDVPVGIQDSRFQFRNKFF